MLGGTNLKFFLPIITGQIERCTGMTFKETRSITAIYLSQLFWSYTYRLKTVVYYDA